VDVPGELGGTVAPPSLKWAMNEMVLGANPAIAMFAASYAFAASSPPRHARAEEARPHIIENGWHCTMVLTEPDAGSDVGAGRTKATSNGGRHLAHQGVKRFITSAESDMTDNVVHFVLARPEGAGPGTKGLSLFIVPKFHVDLETGELGERNGAYVTNVENKMGLKVSTTCEVTFGEKQPAIGTLLGDVHDGIAQMFRVIEHARMLVGTKAIATLSTGYLNALEYAKQRVQGADLTQMPDKAAPRVTITHHPDVRRSLMLQKAYAEGLRALVLFTATQQDIVDQEHRWHRLEESPRRDSPADLANRGQRPAAADRQGPRLGAGLGAAGHRVPADLRRLGLPAGVPDRAVRPRRQDRHPLRGHDRDPGPGLLLPQDHPRPGAGAAACRCRSRSSPRTSARRAALLEKERELLGKGLEDVQGIVGAMVGAAIPVRPAHRRRRHQPLQGRPEHHPPAAGRR
jgi:alkylation response protein AidB-like acyl-CoA dehydrogenase